MAPKRRIRKRAPHRSSIRLTKKRVHKRRLKDALVTKAKRTKRKQQGPKLTPGSDRSTQNQHGITSRSPARGSGRPSRFDLDEESFLRNVPEQLKQYAWRPGQSGNPGGRPKDCTSLTTRLRGLLATKIKGRAHPKGSAAVTYADELMALALQAARRGDFRFFEHIYSRIEGKIPDHVVVEEVQKMVAQESEKLTEQVVKIVSDVALEEFGEKRAAVFRDKLQVRMVESMGEEDVGRRAG